MILETLCLIKANFMVLGIR